jgi:hypothetical protein
MTNPKLTKNLLEVIRSLPDEDRGWLLEQLGGEAGDLSSQDSLTSPGNLICIASATASQL